MIATGSGWWCEEGLSLLGTFRRNQWRLLHHRQRRPAVFQRRHPMPASHSSEHRPNAGNCSVRSFSVRVTLRSLSNAASRLVPPVNGTGHPLHVRSAFLTQLETAGLDRGYRRRGPLPSSARSQTRLRGHDRRLRFHSRDSRAGWGDLYLVPATHAGRLATLQPGCA